MKSALSFRRPAQNARAILSYIPMVALLCLVSSRTVLHHTRFEDGVLGFGIGTLLAYVLADLVARVVPGAVQPREPEVSDLQMLGLSR